MPLARPAETLVDAALDRMRRGFDLDLTDQVILALIREFPDRVFRERDARFIGSALGASPSTTRRASAAVRYYPGTLPEPAALPPVTGFDDDGQRVESLYRERYGR
ncbi:MAG: hypothetical protein M0R75_14665 [Dehalococcoidia bacterium]|nr:hypothetical protein [Dehalococcoidia bacterium]